MKTDHTFYLIVSYSITFACLIGYSLLSMRQFKQIKRHLSELCR